MSDPGLISRHVLCNPFQRVKTNPPKFAPESRHKHCPSPRTRLARWQQQRRNRISITTGSSRNNRVVRDRSRKPRGRLSSRFWRRSITRRGTQSPPQQNPSPLTPSTRLGWVDADGRYSDDDFEYRHVMLPKDALKVIPKDYFDSETGTLRILAEEEWRSLGITQVVPLIGRVLMCVVRWMAALRDPCA